MNAMSLSVWPRAFLPGPRVGEANPVALLSGEGFGEGLWELSWARATEADMIAWGMAIMWWGMAIMWWGSGERSAGHRTEAEGGSPVLIPIPWGIHEAAYSEAESIPPRAAQSKGIDD